MDFEVDLRVGDLIAEVIFPRQTGHFFCPNAHVEHVSHTEK